MMKYIEVNRSAPCDLDFLVDHRYGRDSEKNSTYSPLNEPHDLYGGRLQSPEEINDQRSLQLSQVDVSELEFMTCYMRVHERTTGLSRFKRFKEMSCTLLDAAFAKELWLEPGHTTLKSFYEFRGIEKFDMLGTVLLHQSAGENPVQWGGGHAIMFSRSREDDKWSFFVYQIGLDIDFRMPSLVLLD